MGPDELLRNIVEALAEARAARIQAETALKAAYEAKSEVEALKSSTHKVQYVNTETLGQINQQMSEYLPSEPAVGSVDTEFGKRLAAMGEEFEGADDEIG